MKKNYWKFLIFILTVLFVNIVQVGAASLTVTTNNGVALLKYSKGISFYVGKTSDKNSMHSLAIADYGKDTNDSDGDGNRTELRLNPFYGFVDTSNNYAVVSLPNGRYYAYAKDVYGASSSVVQFNVTGGCTDESKSNQKGTFTVNKCAAVHNKNFNHPASHPVNSENHLVFMNASVATCADGYVEDASKRSVTNNCSNLNFSYRTTYGTPSMPQKYCNVVYSFTCVVKGGTSDPKPPGGGGGGGTTVPAAKLTKLSVSGGNLSPAFKSGTKKYTVNVSGNTTSVSISATAASGSSFVSKFGPRTINDLKYGNNVVYVKVKNKSNKVVTYTITINRADNRSAVNTLSNLTISSGTLTPAFNSSVTNYTVDVVSEISSIAVNATLTDNKSKFAPGYGPTTVPLNAGPNQIYIKVISEKGATNVYTITVNRATLPSKCTVDTDNLALLKDIQFENKIDGVEALKIENFNSKAFVYNDIKVPNAISDLAVTPYFVDEGDSHTITGNEDLIVNEQRTITIVVTSKECPNVSREYNLNVMRQPEELLGADAELANITVANHDEFDFSPEKTDYSIVLKKGEEQLEITLDKVDPNANCAIEGNNDLKYDSKVLIKCTAQDGREKITYTISVDGVEKEKNGFLIIILVIIIILILIYLVLRLLGYRIYFNAAVIGAFFRGIGEKFRNMFDK